MIDDEDDVLGEAWVETMGLAEIGVSNAPLVEVLEEDISQLLGRADHRTLSDDDKLEEAIRRVIRQTSQEEIGKKPEVTVVISRLVAQ